MNTPNLHSIYPKVTVVVACRNEIGFIEKCIDSLLNQSLSKSDYEIWVFDGESSDGTKEYLLQRSQKEPCLSIFDNHRVVAAAGWNEGFRKSKAKYVVMMGGHTYVAPDFLEKNVVIMESENVPCCGGQVISIGEDLKSQAIAMAFNHPFGVGNARYRYSQQMCHVETINYGMYRKSVVEDPEIGPINEKIKRGEDWEYNYKIVKKYGKMLFSPDIKSYYHSRSNFKQLWKRQFDAGYYKLDIIRKFPGSLLYRHLVPFLFVAAILVGLILALLNISFFPLAAILGLYLLVNLGVSTVIAAKSGVHYLPYICWSFFVMHFAYGLGFAAGIFRIVKVTIQPTKHTK